MSLKSIRGSAQSQSAAAARSGTRLSVSGDRRALPNRRATGRGGSPVPCPATARRSSTSRSPAEGCGGTPLPVTGAGP